MEKHAENEPKNKLRINLKNRLKFFLKKDEKNLNLDKFTFKISVLNVFISIYCKKSNMNVFKIMKKTIKK